jgi:tetratricopeptide (TPR) repeat protein
MTVATEDRPLGLEGLDWLERLKQNSRALTFAAVALAVVAGVIWLYGTTQHRKESFAAQELTRARSAAEAGNLPLAASDLARIAERLGGTRAADDATILLNQIRLIQGQTEAAVTALQEFVRGRHPDYVRASAYGLLGGGLEDQAQYREAAQAYREAANAARLDFLKAQYLLDAGRALTAAGDSAGAREVLGEVLRRFGELDQAAEARIRMAELGGEVPEPPRRTERP